MSIRFPPRGWSWDRGLGRRMSVVAARAPDGEWSHEGVTRRLWIAVVRSPRNGWPILVVVVGEWLAQAWYHPRRIVR